jgi:hypothetical protein
MQVFILLLDLRDQLYNVHLYEYKFRQDDKIEHYVHLEQG